MPGWQVRFLQHMNNYKATWKGKVPKWRYQDRRLEDMYIEYIKVVEAVDKDLYEDMEFHIKQLKVHHCDHEAKKEANVAKSRVTGIEKFEIKMAELKKAREEKEAANDNAINEGGDKDDYFKKID